MSAFARADIELADPRAKFRARRVAKFRTSNSDIELSDIELRTSNSDTRARAHPCTHTRKRTSWASRPPPPIPTHMGLEPGKSDIAHTGPRAHPGDDDDGPGLTATGPHTRPGSCTTTGDDDDTGPGELTGDDEHDGRHTAPWWVLARARARRRRAPVGEPHGLV